jgi:hypothetical protein
VEGPHYGPHGAKAYGRAYSGRSRRAPWPGALMDQKRKQARCSKRRHLFRENAAKQLRRRRRRRIHVHRTRNAEETVRVSGRTFPRLSRHTCAVGTMNAEFGGSPAEIFGVARWLGRCQRKSQSLQDERIGQQAGQYAP